MTDDEWWMERHHWYVHDRMDSYITGMLGGILYVGMVLALAIFIPGWIAMLICAALLYFFSRRHLNLVIEDNRDLLFHEDEE